MSYKNLDLIIGPHVSEKAAIGADTNKQFVFKVAKKATKPQIRQAIESAFGVSVLKVNTLNVAGKKKGQPGRVAKHADWKKAYVTIAKDQDIDFSSI